MTANYTLENTNDQQHSRHLAQTCRKPKSGRLDSLLFDSVVFHSPVVNPPMVGKAATIKYLAAAFRVFFNDSFRNVREITSSHDAMLEFQVEIDGVSVNSLNMIKWNDEGKIVDFKVMLRPLKDMAVVGHKMAAVLQSKA
jgi:hypothetical protein